MNAPRGEKIRVVVCEDVDFQHESFIKGLSLYADIDIVGEAWDPDEALVVIKQLAPDVALFDLKYTGWDVASSYQVIRQLRRALPKTRLLALTAYPELTDEALAAGCHRVMHKVKGVGIKKVYAAIVQLAQQSDQVVTWDQLGAREKEIEAFKAFVKTGSRQKAADYRRVSISTQKNQEQAICDRMERFFQRSVTTTSEAVTLAVRHGLIDLDDFNLETPPEG